MEWKEVRLGEVCDLIAGFAFKAKDFGEFPTKVVKIGDIKPPFVDYVGQVGVDISHYDTEKLLKYTVRYGDYVLAMTGATIGKVGKYISEHTSYINQRVLKFSPKQDVDADYINYTICSNIFAKYVVNYIDSESAQPNISAQTISKFVLRIPQKVDDQRRIASILSSIDRKIELNNKINADLEELAQAIFKNWFVDFEPFKDGKFVDSELGMIPEGWRVGMLEDLIAIKYGKDHKKLEEGTIPVYGSGGLIRFVNSWLYEGESVLIPRKGTLDNIMYVNEKFWTVDTMFFSVPKMEYVMKYVYDYIRRFDFSKMNEGTSVPSNTAARLNKMQILIPTPKVIEMYDKTLCPIYNRRKTNKLESTRLSLLRDTLLPRLMSGEIEVPE